jgi:hypothetical protein
VSLSRRVASLEDGAPGPCPVCSHDPDALIRYLITWETDEDAPGESSPPCPSCGNQSTLVVDWEDERSERSQGRYKKLHGHPDDDDLPGSEGSQARYKKLRRLDDVDDDEGAAGQVPDYPPVWDEHRGEGGGPDG